VLATAPLWWGAVRSRSLFEDDHARRLVAGLVLFSLPAAFLGFRFFPHYFVQLYLPLALAAAPWTAAILRSPLTRGARVAIAWPPVLLVGFTAANLALYRGASGVYEETRSVFARVGRQLQEDPCQDVGRSSSGGSLRSST